MMKVSFSQLGIDMITKEEFNNLITKYQNWNKRIDEVESILGFADLLEADWIEYAAILFDDALNMLFTKEATDTIYWWLYEKHTGPSMWDSEGNVIPMDTIEDLWNYIKDKQR